MKSIFNLNNPRHLDVLFIQPTKWCGYSCEDCYVKNHNSSNQAIPIKLWQQLFKSYLLQQNQCFTNQITFSLDTLPKDFHIQKREYMLRVFSFYKDAVIESKDSLEKPDAHITTHDTLTLLSYLSKEELKTKIFDMISLSQISLMDQELLEVIKKSGTSLNWNFLLPKNLDPQLLLQKITNISKLVDQIYLVIRKGPIKQEKSLSDIDIKWMQSNNNTIRFLMQNLSADVKTKIRIDGCLKDAIKHKTSSFGCASNISRLQIWPNGTVSGCAYAESSIGKPAECFDDLLVNIEKARQKYDFKGCHLPEAYSSTK